MGAARKVAQEWRRWRRRGTRNRLPPEGERVVLGRDPVEVHQLVCDRDVRMSLWSLHSFIAFSGLAPRFVVHDDGTLTEEHRRLYERYYDGIVVLDDADSSVRVDEALAPWPAGRRLRRRPDFYCARKLFDPLFFASSDPVLLLDSDILFFRRPDALLRHLAARTPCFSPDYQDAYSLPLQELERFAGRRIRRCVNSGLAIVPVEAYRQRLDRIEALLAHLEREAPDVDPNRHEQTAHALLLTELGASRLPPPYRIQSVRGPALLDPRDAETVSFHFVGEGEGRKSFWDDGVTRLERDLGGRGSLAASPVRGGTEGHR